MSNKHISHQHSLTTMNATRPKSKLTKRLNKSKAKAKKVILLDALAKARAAKK